MSCDQASRRHTTNCCYCVRRPLPYIRKRVADFKKSNFAPEGHPQQRTVGIHMRVRDSFLKEQSVPFFWECATSNFRLNNTVWTQ